MTNQEMYERGCNVAQELIGTTDRIEDHCSELDDPDNFYFLQGIDAIAFECEQCGWWCEISEAYEGNNGDVCEDCTDNQDD